MEIETVILIPSITFHTKRRYWGIFCFN